MTLRPPPFAQVVQVERLSSRISPDVKKAIDANQGRVLVVPWAYGPDCEAASWNWGALWTTPGQRGVFGTVIRERDRWENGFPTFDVGAPWHVPYPVASQLRTTLRGKPALSPDEFMAMFDSIPQRGIRYDDPVRARAIIEWAEAHVDQAAREPLAGRLAFARYSEVVAPFNDRESPLAGTYRFVIQFANADSVVLFGRTELRPTSLIWPNEVARDLKARSATTPRGYYLLVGAGKDVDALPTGRAKLQGYVAASFEPVSSLADSTVWSAGVDLLVSAIALTSDPHLKARLTVARGDTFAELRRAPNFTPGRFVRRADGSVTLHVDLRAGDQLIATVRGERLSTVSLKQ